MGARTSNFENFYFLIEIHCRFINICLLPQHQLVFLQVAIVIMQEYHIAIHIPGFIRIERGLGREPGSQTLKILLSFRNPLYIDVYLSAAPKPALVPANRYNYNADPPYSNTHSQCDFG